MRPRAVASRNTDTNQVSWERPEALAAPFASTVPRPPPKQIKPSGQNNKENGTVN